MPYEDDTVLGPREYWKGVPIEAYGGSFVLLSLVRKSPAGCPELEVAGAVWHARRSPDVDAYVHSSPAPDASRCPLSHAGCRDERELSIATRLGCGAVAGTMGQTVAYPFDVVRRRLQVGRQTKLRVSALAEG